MNKDIDLQLNEIINRADRLKADKAYNSMLLKTVATYVLGIALCVLAVIFMPQFVSGEDFAETSRYGSLIITAPYLGYIVIGILAFILGVLVTILAVKTKQLDEYRKGL